MAGTAEDRGDRAALDPLRRGRPDPASVHARPRAAERDRQGRAARPQPLRGPAGAVLPRPRGAARGPQRPADGDRRRHGRRPRRAARPRRHARRRRPRLRRGGAAVRDLRSPSRGVPPAGQRAGAAARRRRPGPDRERARLPAQAAARRRDRAAARRLRGVRRDRAPAAASRAPPAGSSAARARRRRSRSTRTPTGSWSARSGAPLAQAPDGSERALRQVERAIGETAEHHAHVRLRPLLVRA